VKYLRRGSKLVSVDEAGHEETLLISPLRLVLSFSRHDLKKVVETCRAKGIQTPRALKQYVKEVSFGITGGFETEAQEEEL